MQRKETIRMRDFKAISLDQPSEIGSDNGLRVYRVGRSSLRFASRIVIARRGADARRLRLTRRQRWHFTSADDMVAEP